MVILCHAAWRRHVSVRCWRLLLVLLATLVPLAAAHAQANLRADSLTILKFKQQLKSLDLPDTARLRILREIALAYYDPKPEAGLPYAKEAVAVARRVGNGALEARMLIAVCTMAHNIGDEATAIHHARQLMKLGLRLPESDRWTAGEGYRMLGGVEAKQGDYAAARRYYGQAADWALRYPSPRNRVPGASEAWAAMILLDHYYTQLEGGDRADSVLQGVERYGRQAVGYYQRNPDQQLYALAHVYQTLGAAMAARGRLDSAVTYYERAILRQQKIEETASEAATRVMLARVRLQQGQAAEALRQAQRVVALHAETGEPNHEAYVVLADALAATGRHAEAYRLSRRANAVADSIALATEATEVAKHRARLETYAQQSRIRDLTQQRLLQQEQARRQQQRIWALAAVLAAVVLGLGTAVVLYRRLRAQRALLATQNVELATQRDALTQARATQDRLYALIAHDLRSPVVAFTGLADLLNRYVTRNDTERLAGLGGRIRQAAQNLSELLDNLLNWAVSQRGELTPQPRPIRATELLTEIAALYQNVALAADISLTTDIVDPTLFVHADPDMTRTILRNLAGNALKATPNGGSVSLRAERDARGGVRLQIRDSGAGLSESALEQLNQATPQLRVAGRDSGAGLGLLLSRSFAEVQGGSLVLGAAPAGGTDATLTLPLAA